MRDLHVRKEVGHPTEIILHTYFYLYPVYPLGSEQIMFSRQTSAEDRGKIMKKATQTKASFVPKQNDFSAVEEEKQLNKNLVLKKLIKSPYDLE